MKQKKKNNKVNNKFDFDNDFIIGISSPKEKNKRKKTNTNKVKNKKKKSAKAKVAKKDKNVIIEKKESSDIQKKISAKVEKSKRRKKVVLKILVLIILLVGAGCFLCLSPTFDINEIIVEDNSKISKDELISLSEIKLSENIFSISKRKIANNIKNDSYVESVKIKRVLPNKVKIIVEERTPAFIVEITDGKYIYIDKNGYVLEFSNERLELPILIGATTEFEAMIDEKNNQNRLNEKDLKKIDTVLEILSVAKEYEIKDLISKIDITDSKDYILIMESVNKTVHLGDCNDLNNRILWTKEILNSESDINGEIFVDRNNKPPYFRESI